MRLVLLVLFCAFCTSAIAEEKQNRMTESFSLLKKCPFGRTLIQKAKRRLAAKTDSELIALFRSSSVSKTDATLTRQFNPETGEEFRKRDVTIYLRAEQNINDLVLDMAHELAHFVFIQPWDPYDPALTAAQYIYTAIEKPGGEVDAIDAECRVGLELSIARGLSAERCKTYLIGIKGQVDRNKIKEDLYKVGRHKGQFVKTLGLESELFPLLSDQPPALFSSTGKAPYPIALLAEFKELTDIACENSRRRIESIGGRSPASEFFKEKDAYFLSRRCNN